MAARSIMGPVETAAREPQDEAALEEDTASSCAALLASPRAKISRASAGAVATLADLAASAAAKTGRGLFVRPSTVPGRTCSLPTGCAGAPLMLTCSSGTVR